jgi:phosphatidate cytidylyltransferase
VSMTSPRTPEAVPPGEGAPAPDKPNRAGRNLPAAVASAVVLLAVVFGTLFLWKPSFMAVVAVAVVVAVWELDQGFQAKSINLPQEPLMAGGVAMVLVAYFYGAPALVSATAITALVTLLWLLRRGVDGYVRDASASIFALVYLPFLGSFVALLLRPDDGSWRVLTFVLVTIASDIGGYIAGVLFGRHKMAPVISPKKSWEGFAGSALLCMAVGWATVTFLLDGRWWVGVVVGAVAVVMATLGDLCESVIKRDLGIKDMSQIIPGHGGLMDRLDSLLATVAPIWLLLFYLVDVSKAPGL